MPLDINLELVLRFGVAVHVVDAEEPHLNVSRYASVFDLSGWSKRDGG